MAHPAEQRDRIDGLIRDQFERSFSASAEKRPRKSVPDPAVKQSMPCQIQVHLKGLGFGSLLPAVMLARLSSWPLRQATTQREALLMT